MSTITIKVGDKTFTFEKEEARAIHNELQSIFGGTIATQWFGPLETSFSPTETFYINPREVTYTD